MGLFNKVNDPFDTMGTSPAPSRRRKSDWLVMEQRKHPGTKACKDCKGTGDSGRTNRKGEMITCKSCRGFGY